MGADNEPDAGTGDAFEVQREQAVKHVLEADLIPLVKVGGWDNVLVRSDIVRYRPERVSAAAPCLSESSRKTRRAQENAECIGGLRSPWKTVRKLPRLRVAARKVREVLEHEFANDADLANVVDLLGKEVVAGSGSHEWVSAKASDLGQRLVRTLGGRRIEKDPAIGGRWNVELVSAFIDAAGDPEGDLVEWLRTGCPAGVAKEITSCGIFPATDTDDVSQLERWRLVDEEPLSNYKSVEEAVELSGAEVDRLIEKGYAVKYESWQDVIEALGEVLVSKLACIVKTREDGTLKVRNVLDLRRSGYNDGVQLKERIVLPRVKDLVEDVCDLKRCAGNSEECYGMVADFEDAFHTLQVDPSEWRYLVARHPVKGFVGYRTVLCGGAGCPLLWGRAAAFLGRSGQSLFCERELRTQIYVDDPVTIVRGSLTKARECAALLLWWWLALGLQISWKKGSFGQEFRWIGVSVDLRFWDSVVVSLPRSFADSVLELIAGIRDHRGDSEIGGESGLGCRNCASAVVASRTTVGGLCRRGETSGYQSFGRGRQARKGRGLQNQAQPWYGCMHFSRQRAASWFVECQCRSNEDRSGCGSMLTRRPGEEERSCLSMERQWNIGTTPGCPRTRRSST